MEPGDRKMLTRRLAVAFSGAVDVTPADGQPAHILLPAIRLPKPWKPSSTRALTVWEGWPGTRPQFVIDESVTGETGEPPRSHHPVYLLDQSWRGFSFNFAWSGDDPVRAVQLWLARFTVERS
jgi:hypothetical protein